MCVCVHVHLFSICLLWEPSSIATSVAMSIPTVQIMVTKFHSPLKKSLFHGEITNFRAEAEKDQDVKTCLGLTFVPKSKSHQRNVDLFLKGLRTCSRLRRLTGYDNWIWHINWFPSAIKGIGTVDKIWVRSINYTTVLMHTFSFWSLYYSYV